jgi:5,10-methylenetetrahydromethanopterin reductase
MGIGIGDAAAKDIGSRPTTTADLEGAVKTIRELWAGQEVSFNGVPTRLWYASSCPRSIPVYLAGSGPRLFKLAGQIADGILLNVGADLKYIQSALAIVEEGARSVGRSRKDIRIVARIPTCVSEDPDARRYVRSRVGLVVLRRVPAGLSEEDLQAVETIRRAYDPQEHLRLDAAYANHVTNSLVDKFSLAGKPEECLERVRALMRSGLDELNLTFMHPNTEDLLRTFAERIVKKLKL